MPRCILWVSALILSTSLFAQEKRLSLESENGRIQAIQFPGGQRVEYEYGGDGKLKSKTFRHFRMTNLNDLSVESNSPDTQDHFQLGLLLEMSKDFHSLPARDQFVEAFLREPSIQELIEDRENSGKGLEAEGFVISLGSSEMKVYQNYRIGLLRDLRTLEEVYDSPRSETEIERTTPSKKFEQVYPKLFPALMNSIDALDRCSPTTGALLHDLIETGPLYATQKKVKRKAKDGTDRPVLFSTDRPIGSSQDVVMATRYAADLLERPGMAEEMAFDLKTYFGDENFDDRRVRESPFFIAFLLLHEMGHVRLRQKPNIDSLVREATLLTSLGNRGRDPLYRRFRDYAATEFAERLEEISERTASYFALDMLAPCLE